MTKSSVVKKELIGGAVESAQVFAERTDREIVKLLRVISVMRTPKTLIGRMALQTKAALYALEIDEPTVMAMAKVFTDFRKEHPDGKAPPSPPAWPVENEGKSVDIDVD
jgi:hypothetical protein